MKTLVDSYNRNHTYLRISVTDRCNLRCHYCMPAEGIELKERENILRFEEILRLTKIFAEMGINKIRLTGGEPLVRKGLTELISNVARIQEINAIGMTTNGFLLPQFITQLKAAGLTHLNISLDTLKPERFSQITRREGLTQVLEGIDSALKEGVSPLKINTVIMGGINDDEIPDFVEFVRDKPLILRFIEYMPFKSNRWNNMRFIPYLEIKKRIEMKYDLQPCHTVDQSISVAKNYQIPGFTGKIGFITPISNHFCDACNRLRLTADGHLKSCLFYTPELNLKNVLRNGASEDEIKSTIQKILQLKPQKHPSTEELLKMENRYMTEIGG